MIICTTNADRLTLKLLLDVMSMTATEADLPDNGSVHVLNTEELVNLCEDIGLTEARPT